MSRLKQRAAPPIPDSPSSSESSTSPTSSSSDAVISQFRDLVDQRVGHEHTLDTAAAHIRAAALVARLKALHRANNSATRARQQATAEARQEMDQAHLGLQNFLYEKRHLEREIEKCRQFASIYQDVPLYTLEEFQRLAPEAARTDVVLADEHQLMLNRLSFELAERQRLDLRKRELIAEKEELLKQSRAKASLMDNVKVQIDTLVKAAAEIQKKVDELVIPEGSQG